MTALILNVRFYDQSTQCLSMIVSLNVLVRSNKMYWCNIHTSPNNDTKACWFRDWNLHIDTMAIHTISYYNIWDERSTVCRYCKKDIISFFLLISILFDHLSIITNWHSAGAFAASCSAAWHLTLSFDFRSLWCPINFVLLWILYYNFCVDFICI